MTAVGISEGKLFRDSLKGYNRQDVHAFIEKMSKEHAESESALKVSNDRIVRQKSELERIIVELRDANNSLEEQNQALLKNATAFEQQKDDKAKAALLEDEAIHLREQLNQKDKELEELRRKAAQTSTNLTDGQSSLVIHLDGDDGTGKFDEAFKMIGSFLQLANETAKTTISEAKGKAEDIIGKAYEEKESYIKERQDKVDELNRQYKELCVRSSGIIKELIQVHGSLNGQIKDSDTLFSGDSNGTV